MEIFEAKVLLTVLENNTTYDDVSNFFSFCGPISSVVLRPGKDTSEAIVSFQTEGAYRTALLLSNAMIKEREIHIESHHCESRFSDVSLNNGNDQNIDITSQRDPRIAVSIYF